MSKAFITGGAGFIGANLVRLLQSQGWACTVYDDLSVGDAKRLEGTDVEIVVADVNDCDRLIRAADGHDVVFHLAAGAGVIDSIERPLENFHVNARGTLSALWACKQAGVPRLVFSSSNAPLGENAYPASEEKLPRPMSPYGASKHAGEGYTLAFNETYGLDAVVVRFANAYGPYSAHKTNVLPTFIRRIVAKEPLKVFGDGEQTRDFVHVDDLCQGLLLAATNASAPGEVFQLASGVETSVNRLIEILKEASGADFEVERKPPRAGEIRRNYSLIEKARKALSFEPKWQLEEGVKQVWQWFQNEGRDYSSPMSDD